MQNMQSQKGFSLIEVLVAVGLLGILITAVLTVTVGSDLKLFADRVVGGSSCRAEAHRILNNFKNKGLMRSFYYFNNTTHPPAALPASGTNVTPPAADSNAREFGLLFTQRWNNSGAASAINVPYSTTSPAISPPVIRPYTQIMGTMTSLETVYNQLNGNVCTTGANWGLAASSAVAPLTSLLPIPIGIEDPSPTGTSTGLLTPEAYLRIRAFDTGTGALQPCGGADVHIRPPRGTNITVTNVPDGLNNSQTGSSNYPAAPAATLSVGTPGTAVDNLGWMVTITIEHTDRKGLVENCSVTEKFQYPSIKPTADKLLTVLDSLGTGFEGLNTTVTSTGTLGYAATDTPIYRACGSGSGFINIRIDNARPGSIFMCRNLTEPRALVGASTINTVPRVLDNSAGGFRQSFFSNELIKNLNLGNDGADAVWGDLFVLGLYYPPGTYYCDAGDGCTGIPIFPTNTQPFVPMSPTMDGFYYPSSHLDNTNTAYNPALETGTWRPCEYTPIYCATSTSDPTIVSNLPVRAQFFPGSGVNPDSYQINYNDISPGCEVHLQVAEVDPAYNVRATEVREYVQEAAPGNKLCYTGPTGVGGYPASRWYFVCDATPTDAVNTVGSSTVVPHCAVSTPRNNTIPPFTSTQYDLSAACCIDFPGDPSVLENGTYKGGTWREPAPALFFDP